MRIAYVVLAHKYPEMLSRLVARLSCPYSDFFIHIDKSKNISPFRLSLEKVRTSKTTIEFVKRYTSSWGSIGLVKATISAFSKISRSSKRYDYVVILSGQDYPLMKNSDIVAFFKVNYGSNYISYFPCTYDLQQDKWKQKIITDRLGKYHIRLFGSRYEYPGENNILINSIFRIIFNKDRKHLSYVNPYADSQWFCITMDAVRYIADCESMGYNV